MRNESCLELVIVIVNYKTPQFVIDCLVTLLPELAAENAEVVIVDNNSGDDSCEQIVAWLADHDNEGLVRLIAADHNSGFAGGNNDGLAAAKADFYLLLNSDTLVCRGAIRRLLNLAAEHPRRGLFSPKLEWPDGVGQESCFRFHSPVSEFLRAAQTGIFDQFFHRYVVTMPVQQDIAHPSWTSFACVLIRREVFEEVGGLDDGYFMYFEDVEFCHRARKAGWTIAHDPSASVVHLRGGSSPVKEQSRLKKRVPKYYYESRARYFYQTHGWWGLTSANFLWSLGRLVSKTRQVLGRPDKAAIECEWLDIWTNWLHPLKPYTHPQEKH